MARAERKTGGDRRAVADEPPALPARLRAGLEDFLEALRVGYRWASARHHHLVIDGMQERLATFQTRAVGVSYYPSVERRPGEGKGLLAALARMEVEDDEERKDILHFVDLVRIERLKRRVRRSPALFLIAMT